MNRINPQKLLHSKWTATEPRNREKHFLVTELKLSDQGEVDYCLLEAVLTKRSESIDWQQLKYEDRWLPGWK